MYLVMNTPHWKTIWGLQLSFYITAQTATGSFESVSIIIELFPFFKVFTERLQNKNPNSTTVAHTLEQQGRPIRLECKWQATVVFACFKEPPTWFTRT